MKEILSHSAEKLTKVALSPYKEASAILGFSLGVDNLWLIAHDSDIVDIPKDFLANIKKREEFYPLEYILKNTSFYARDFYTDERVLIPRPETELLVDEVVNICKDFKDLTIAEVGTGSGIISIMLAILLPNIKIIATDISESALEVAKINAKKYDMQNRIRFIKTNLLDNIDEKIDVIVSNPPYIKKDEKLEKNLSYEPDLALFAGAKGDEILRQIIDEAMRREIKVLACEMGYNQKEKITNYLKKQNKKAKFYKDLAGIDRGFVIKGNTFKNYFHLNTVS
ncbi:MAG: peptide chain release factor N(5)-glutamine methyltransferase [Epsilonproteobacteria bacterium]|nr:peptide chain release factor N(5)-glutamine methyltransferase [Campylobacterota bacterium]